MGIFNFILTIEALKTSLSRIGTRFYSLMRFLIDWGVQSDVPNWTSPAPTIRWESRKVINRRQPFKLDTVILNTKLCLLVSSIHRPASRIISSKSWPKNWISLSLSIWIISSFIQKTPTGLMSMRFDEFWIFWKKIVFLPTSKSIISIKMKSSF